MAHDDAVLTTLMATLTRRHCQRLRAIYRSAGWPCQDMVEVELLAAGLLERVVAASGHESLRVTDAGIAVLAKVYASNQAARSAHETLVQKVALEMARAGRLVWRGLSLRVQVPQVLPTDTANASMAWVVACPDVFSIRHTTVEAYLAPIVHEIKVSRSDLLGDLKKPSKRAAYLGMGGECWYVLGSTVKGQPIAQADEIPVECGVMQFDGIHLTVERPAPRRAVHTLPLHVWMALAKANAVQPPDDAVTPCL
jgi:hypothetical protein